MKKTFILLGMLTLNTAFAQTGKVGINTENPRATMDIVPRSNNLTGSSNEGILIPRVSKGKLNSIAPANLTESTLVYVNDVTAASNNRTVDVTAKGFYYYSTTANKWVKIAEGVIAEQDLRLVGSANHITQDAGVGSNGTSVGTGSDNIAIGRRTLSSLSGGNRNIAIGAGSLTSAKGGVSNIAIGSNSLTSVDGGSRNIAIGENVLNKIEGGLANIGIGDGTLANLSGGSIGAVAIGYRALYSSTVGDNLAIGYQSLLKNTTGKNNFGIGNNALINNTTGSDNTAIGNSSLGANTTGYENISIGSHTLSRNTTGRSNSAYGVGALLANTTGSFNIAMGRNALTNNTTADHNIALGYDALSQNGGASSFNIALGVEALKNNKGQSNIALGQSAAQNIGSSYNIAIGINALKAETTTGTTNAHNNIALGHNTLTQVTEGYQNIAMGMHSLREATTAVRTVAIGARSMEFMKGGFANVGVGTNTLQYNVSGDFNTALGGNALMNNTTGHRNIAIGQHSMWNYDVRVNNTGNDNIAMGNATLRNNTSGFANIAIGYQSMFNNTTSQHNIGLGGEALYANTTGDFNTALGSAALRHSTGAYNIGVGRLAGEWIRNGNANIHIGNQIIPDAGSDLNNVVVIGNGVGRGNLNPTTGQNNTILLGIDAINDARSPRVGIGTYKPDAKVHIRTNGAAAFKMQDTTQGEGKVLTSDANGEGRWKYPAMKMMTGVWGSPGVNIPPNTNRNTFYYTGSYISIPPASKYIVEVTQLMAFVNEEVARGTFWLRTIFTDSPTSNVPSPHSGEYVAGRHTKWLLSGKISTGDIYSMLTGAVILTNPDPNNYKTFYYKAGWVTTTTNQTLWNFGGHFWGEGSMVAFPIQ